MKTIPFSRYRFLFLAFSIALIVISSLITILRGGFNFSIDFEAGLNVEIRSSAEAISEQSLHESLDALFAKSVQIQSINSQNANRFSIKIINEDIPDFQKIAEERIIKASPSISIDSIEYISPDMARSLSTETFYIVPIALLLIMLYIWIRFRLDYAIAAILALLHDVLILLGLIGALQLEFSSATIAAILTVIGYSLNDTIVIFDRIRENNEVMHDLDFNDIVDLSITQSLSRTIITSLTTLIAILAIVFFAYGTIRVVAIDLTIGILVGTYSSIYIASTFLIASYFRRQKRLALKHSSPGLNIAVSKKAAVPEPRQKNLVKHSADEIEELTRLKAKKRATARRKKRRR